MPKDIFPDKPFPMMRKILIALTLPILLGVLLTVPGQLFAQKSETTEAIQALTKQISTTPDGKPKAKLHLYRARHYARLGEKVEANKDYQAALTYNYAGWIANEYGYFLYNCGEYGLAYKSAKKVMKDFPQFENEAKKLKKKAGDKFKEQYLEENPPEIVMDNETDPNYVSRHDLIRKQQPKKGQIYKYPSVTKASTSSSSSKAKAKPRRRST
jgi:tetratricopeptide (TPR) repeat protein